MLKRTLLLTIVFCLLASSAFGFKGIAQHGKIVDGKRQGFIIGIGLGGHQIKFTQDVSLNGNRGTTKRTKSGLSVDFAIGYAPSNKLELFLFGKAADFSITNFYEDEVTINNTLAGFGGSYFFSIPQNDETWVESFYLSSGFGRAIWSAPEIEGAADHEGSGFFVGAGYEFLQYVRFEVNVVSTITSFSGIDFDGRWEIDTNSTFIMVGLKAMAF